MLRIISQDFEKFQNDKFSSIIGATLKTGNDKDRIEFLLQSVHSTGSQTIVFSAIFPVCACEKFQFHVSNRFAPAFIRFRWKGDLVQLLFASDA